VIYYYPFASTSQAENELEFPSSLGRTERAYVHKMAAEMGFKSKSRGLGQNRYTAIRKSKMHIDYLWAQKPAPPEKNFSMLDFIRVSDPLILIADPNRESRIRIQGLMT
jgi:hypothetical protein